MNLVELENRKLSLLSQISDPISETENIILISSFFDSLLADFSKEICTPYFLELLPHYLLNLSSFQVSGDDLPEFIKIIDKAKHFVSFINTLNYSNELNAQIKRLEANRELLTSVLEGKKHPASLKNCLSFPVLYSNHFELKKGFNEYFSINLQENKKTTVNEFLIFPSSLIPDSSFLGQLKIAWNFAKNYFTRYNRGKIKSFTIIVRLNNQNATYTGESAGAVLAVSLIIELMKYHDKLSSISPFANISVSGSIDSSGSLMKIDGEILSIKVKTVFYSDIDYFIVPIDNISDAQNRLQELKSKYPSRNLEIIPASSVEDILDRRKLFKVGRQNYNRWIFKKTLKHKYSLISFLLLMLVVSYVVLSKQDDNITELSATNQVLLTKNKYGEELWERRVNFSNESDVNIKAFIFDKEKDGKNELLICSEDPKYLTNPEDAGGLALYDHEGNIIWRQKYSFNIKSNGEPYDGNYFVTSIIGIIKSDTGDYLLVTVHHPSYWPSAIIKVNLETGKQFGDIFWHPGLITSGTIDDINKDGETEIICSAISNGMKGSALFIISQDKIAGSAPSTERYKFNDIPISDFILYVIFPSTDISVYYKHKYNIPMGKPVLDEINKRILFDIREGGNSNLYQHGSIKLALNFELTEFEPIITDRFNTVRDQLVDAGVLPLPYTSTKAYSDLLKSSRYSGEIIDLKNSIKKTN